MGKLLPLLMLLTFAWNQAHASLELRAHYGQFQGKGKDYNDDFAITGGNWPKMKAPTVMGGDLLFVFPVVGFSVGARYEMLSEQKASGSYIDSTDGFTTVDTKTTGSRTSALVGYRFLDTGAYLGLLGHYGISQDLKHTLTMNNSSGSGSFSTKGKMDASYGIGVEGGIHLGGFLVGAEVGYTMFKAKALSVNGTNFQVTNYTTGQTKDVGIDFSGTYYKVLIGFTFL
jgi:hypothetical protein